ncbi:sensor histidine kinase [Mesobacterium pallidum]|uniref:sensor histidine kinase n=1 Tax=Mesobacterium pallidum TaxID=2872037 RepID=UPI001EE30074|nr:hybrid sensor histidine kinase/response regulator [Mesobacterium pallidum]
MKSLATLIIDDDRGDRMSLRRTMRRLGIARNPIECADAASALALVEDHMDLILLDHLLPGASGTEALQPLRAKWPQAGIILLTGHGNEEIAKTAIKNGANDYLAKSALTEGRLEHVIQTAVGVARMQFQLEEQRHDLEMFTHVLLHDVKAPIRNIRFLAETLKEDLLDHADPEVQDTIALLDRSAADLSQLVESLAVHVNAQKDETRKLVRAAELVDRARRAVARDLELTGGRLETDIAELSVWCEPAPLAQVIQNLLANAIKYGGKDPLVRVRVTEEIPGQATFRVTDSGIGVPEEYREKIFAPFTRGANAGDLPGSGLGLATCRKIVRRHAGQIWHEPAPCGGSTFVMRLPMGAVEGEPDATELTEDTEVPFPLP